MTKATDILKELENIGAMGGKVQLVAARPAVVEPLPVTEEAQPSAASTSLPSGLSDVLSSFSVQLEQLESALHGMLEWCAYARGELEANPTAPPAPEAEPETEPETEQAESTDSVAKPAVGTIKAEAPAEKPRPKLSLDEIRKHFLDPDWQPTALHANGAANGTSSTQAMEPQK